jgi:hypothetical protein
MKNESASMPDLWSEVLTYLKTSLSPVDRSSSTGRPPDLHNVYVFKTSVAGFADVLKIDAPLSKLVGNRAWSIDLDDEDKVLRVVCSSDQAKNVVRILQNNGYSCTQMPY